MEKSVAFNISNLFALVFCFLRFYFKKQFFLLFHLVNHFLWYAIYYSFDVHFPLACFLMIHSIFGFMARSFSFFSSRNLLCFEHGWSNIITTIILRWLAVSEGCCHCVFAALLFIQVCWRRIKWLEKTLLNSVYLIMTFYPFDPISRLL